MNITPGQKFKVYSNEHGYFIRLSTKNARDEWVNAFLYLKFKKGVSVEPKSTILIKDSWLTFYINEKNNNKVVLYLFVNDFDLVLDNE